MNKLKENTTTLQERVLGVDPEKLIIKPPIFIREDSSLEVGVRGRILKVTNNDGSFGYIIQTRFLWWWITYKNSWAESEHIYSTIEEARAELIELAKSRKIRREVVEYIK